MTFCLKVSSPSVRPIHYSQISFFSVLGRLPLRHSYSTLDPVAHGELARQLDVDETRGPRQLGHSVPNGPRRLARRFPALRGIHDFIRNRRQRRRCGRLNPNSTVTPKVPLPQVSD